MINLKKDFPIFNEHPELAFLDNASTTQKPACVIQALTSFYTSEYANVHRGLYPLSEQTTARYEQSRSKIAHFINAPSSDEIIFTSGTTEGINLVASTWGLNNIKENDEILLTEVEHHANLLPWQHLAQKTGARLKFINFNPATGLVSLDSSLITKRTKLAAITHYSNVFGNIWGSTSFLELIQLTKQVQSNGGVVLVDAAQGIAHHPIDVQILNPDFLVFSGHKIFGPTGIGVLYMKKSHQETIPPYKRGGSMISSASYTDATWALGPYKFEAGTPPIAGAIGLAAAVDYIRQYTNIIDVERYESSLIAYLLQELRQFKNVTIVSPPSSGSSIIIFYIQGIHAHDIAAFLGMQEVAVRAGHHCAQPLFQKLNIDSAVRVSVSIYNTKEDIDKFIKALDKALSFFTINR